MPSAIRLIDRLDELAGDVALTSVARGDVLVRGASKWNNLAAGTSGYFLKSNGAGADPSWAAVSVSPGGSSGQVQYNSSGSFAGAAAVTYAASGANLTVTAQAATDVPLTVKGATSQSANLVECKNSTGTTAASIHLANGLQLANGVDTFQAKATGSYYCELLSAHQMRFSPGNGAAFTNAKTSAGPGVMEVGRDGLCFADFVSNPGITFGNYYPTDSAASNFSLAGNNAYADAATNLVGGNLTFAAGNGAANSSGAAHGGKVYIAGGTGYGTGSVGNVCLAYTGSAARGNVSLFGAGSFGGGANVVFIANAGTNPSTNPTGGGILYCDGGALKYRGSSGTVTTLGVA